MLDLATRDLPDRRPDEALQRIARVMVEEAALLRERCPWLARRLLVSASRLRDLAVRLRPA